MEAADEGVKDISMADSRQTIIEDPEMGKTIEHKEYQPCIKSQEDRQERAESPTDSQKTISDDDEIDYSIKPEFYDPDLDDKDELWVQKQRKGHSSDAVLSCPACFTTLCLESQRHEKYLTQYRAVFVTNCKINSEGLGARSLKRKRGMKGRGSGHNEAAPPATQDGETFKPVCCAVCSTEVGVIDEEEVYHFFNVLPSEC